MYLSIKLRRGVIPVIIIVSIIITVVIIYNSQCINNPVLSKQSEMIFKVVVDPGHGSIDTGTSYGEIYEKDINLRVALLVAEELEKVNIIPILTRKKDKLYMNSRQKDIRHRPEIANKNKADLFISIHANNFPSSQPSGSQVFYKPGSGESRKLAEEIQQELIKLRQANQRSIKNGDFYVLKKAQCPAVLIETGFLSNPTDRERLTDPVYQKQLAIALKNGIINFFQSRLSGKRQEKTLRTNVSLESNDEHPSYQLYYLTDSPTGILLVKRKLSFPTNNFFKQEYSNLSFKEIMIISAINQLLDPPDNLISPLPAKTKIDDVKINDGIATIDFSKETKTSFSGGATVELYSLEAVKKTLFSIPGIKGLNILINGKKGDSIGGHIFLKETVMK
ncbi:N-acetylmuramoyl-L-alanine amidase [Iocasia frigidifontis]|nr:N-acetylmuramoyl-L-alanine amidase [Iocasia fonsfrigidae]